MRAIRYHSGGGPDVLEVDDVDRPAVGPDEILVAIRAASINPVDAKRRARGSGPVPKTTGSDFAGVVESVGENVDGFAPGDRVCGTGLHTERFRGGSFAEFAAVPLDVVTRLPDDVSFEDGAALALAGVTAWRALVDHATLAPADACLVHGGTGGVGHIAVQLSSLTGAHTVATAGSSEARRAARELGADAVVAYDRDDLLEAVSEHSPRGFDVVLDHRVEEYLQFDIEAAAFGGRIVHYGGGGAPLSDPRTGRAKNLTFRMMNMGNLVTNPDLPAVAGILDRLLDLASRGSLAPRIARTYDLEEATDAHRAVIEDSFVGKLTVTI